MTHFDYDIFLSFSSLNEDLARPLYERLTGSKLRVFWSDETMKQNVGESWFTVVQKSLASSKHFLLLWTPEAKKSKFVKLEYESFIIASIHDDDRRLIPLLVDEDDVGEMPLFLRSYQGFDVNGDLKELLARLGGQFKPLEAEVDKLRKQLDEARNYIDVLKHERAMAQQATPKDVLSELDSLRMKHVKLLENYKKAMDVLGQKEALIREFAVSASKAEEDDANKGSTSKSKENQKPAVKEPEKYFTDEHGIEFILIEPGTFAMGSRNGDHNERPVHEVEITNPFYLGRYPVTQAEWESIEGYNPSKFKGQLYPVENVSWGDVQSFLSKLQNKGVKYRLPTEAEWEYACRAGTTTDYNFGDDARELGEYAWYAGNSRRRTHPVGQKKPNPWGVFDMHGNVYEWVWDRFSEEYYTQFRTKKAIDPTGPGSGTTRVIRGGGWGNYAKYVRSAYRVDMHPSKADFGVGFRLLRTIR